MAKKPTDLVGFKQTAKSLLGPFQVPLMRMIKRLGKKAYGAELERQLTTAGIDTDRGQVYQMCSRLEGRGFLSSSIFPDPQRPSHTVTVYALTKEGEKALAATLAVYDGNRLFEESSKKGRG